MGSPVITIIAWKMMSNKYRWQALTIPHDLFTQADLHPTGPINKPLLVEKDPVPLPTSLQDPATRAPDGLPQEQRSPLGLECASEEQMLQGQQPTKTLVSAVEPPPQAGVADKMNPVALDDLPFHLATRTCTPHCVTDCNTVPIHC